MKANKYNLHLGRNSLGNFYEEEIETFLAHHVDPVVPCYTLINVRETYLGVPKDKLVLSVIVDEYEELHYNTYKNIQSIVRKYKDTFPCSSTFFTKHEVELTYPEEEVNEMSNEYVQSPECQKRLKDIQEGLALRQQVLDDIHLLLQKIEDKHEEMKQNLIAIEKAVNEVYEKDTTCYLKP